MGSPFRLGGLALLVHVGMQIRKHFVHQVVHCSVPLLRRRQNTCRRLNGLAFDDKGIERLEGFPTREQMIEHWEKRSGRAVAGSIDYWEVFGAMRFCAIFIGLGDRLVEVGLMPAENSMAVSNMVTDALARLLDHD